MNSLLFFLKRLFIYTVSIMVAYVFIANVTLTVSSFIDVLVKSICFAFILAPLSLFSHFSPFVAQGSIYINSFTLSRPLEDTFKNIRTLMKSMIDIELTNSSSEKHWLKLKSEFSETLISLKKIGEKETEVTLKATPKVYLNIQDYDKYVKDVINVSGTIKLNLESEKYETEDIYSHDFENNAIMEFKPCIILYYRMIKAWVLISISLSFYFLMYYLAINVLPEFATVFFFAVIFLYMLYIFTNEIESVNNKIICPACKTPQIKNKYLITNYVVPVKCHSCGKQLLETKDDQRNNTQKE